MKSQAKCKKCGEMFNSSQNRCSNCLTLYNSSNLGENSRLPLILGIVGFIFFPVAIAAIVVSKKNPGHRDSKIALILGIVALVFTFIPTFLMPLLFILGFL